jgi:hypothetical protein
MAILTADQGIAGMLNPHPICRASVTTEGAGTFHSWWKGVGSPGIGANPPLFSAGSGYVPTDATIGSFPFVNNLQTYIGRLSGAGSVAGMLTLYDRIWACSGFSTATTSAQNITTPGLPGRQAGDYIGVEAWLEIYTAPGATAANWTLGYTDQDGNAGAQSVYAHPANAETVGQMIRMPYAAGDNGVQSVQSFTCSVSSGTAGDVGITLMRRIVDIPIATGGIVLDMFGTGRPKVADDACIAMMQLCTATSTGAFVGLLTLTQG